MGRITDTKPDPSVRITLEKKYIREPGESIDTTFINIILVVISLSLLLVLILRLVAGPS